VQPSRPAPSLQPLTILCVDDEAVALSVRKSLLERAGYHVLSALTADQALQIFRTNHIDVVVSDHLLPGATGTEMACTMKLARPEVPILLLTGVVDPPAGTEHVDKFINKAEGPDKLLQAIAEVTGAKAPVTSTAPFLMEYPAAPREDSDQCAATMAHEINNPLNSLLSLLHLADAEPGMTGTAHGYLALAREEVKRLAQIVQAALHGHRGDKPRENTDVPQLLWSVIELYKPRFESRGISVETRGCSGGKLAVYSGPLRQMFSNLLLNAADAMPNGGRLRARVSNACEWSGQRRRGLRVTFADSGYGIPAQNIRRIFEPSFTTKGAHGSGLGLGLVMTVVRKHSGSLHVRSSTECGRSGTIFSVFLPATHVTGSAA
jgi:signal transduction histidine kinase